MIFKNKPSKDHIKREIELLSKEIEYEDVLLKKFKELKKKLKARKSSIRDLSAKKFGKRPPMPFRMGWQ